METLVPKDFPVSTREGKQISGTTADFITVGGEN